MTAPEGCAPIVVPEAVECRQCVVVGRVEFVDGALVLTAVDARGRSVEVARGITDERPGRVGSIGTVENVERRQSIAVRRIELVDGALVVAAIDTPGRSVEVARGIGHDRAEGVLPLGAVEAVEGRERVVVGGLELEDGAVVRCAAEGGRSVKVARGVGDDCRVRVGSVGPAEAVQGRQRVAVRGIESEDGAVAKAALGRSVKVARSVGEEGRGRMRSIGPAEAVEG